MNRAERRRQAKLERTSGKVAAGKLSKVDAAIEQMIEPIVVLLNAREFDRAETALKELLAASPGHAEGLHLYGLLLCQTGREEEGIASLREATVREPKMALYWNNLAAAYSRRQDWDASLAAVRQAIALDPNYVEPQHILANVLFSQGNIAEGTDALAKLLKLSGTDAKLWLKLARNRASQQRNEEAEAAYLKAQELSPGSLPLLREFAAFYMNSWRYDEARRLNHEADRLEAERQA